MPLLLSFFESFSFGSFSFFHTITFFYSSLLILVKKKVAWPCPPCTNLVQRKAGAGPGGAGGGGGTYATDTALPR